MLDPETYIKQGLGVVRILIKQGDLQNAFNACQELLNVNPYHRRLQRYLRKIQKLIIKSNEKKINDDIAVTMHLWKENRFEELLEIYAKLYKYAPQYRKLAKLIEKANAKLSSQQKNMRADFLKKALAAIAGLIKEKRFGDTIQACNELLSIDPLNSAAQEYLKETKTKLVEQKLRENERLIDSTEFDRALEFYNALLSIDPENQKVKRLALHTKEHLAEREMIAARIHLNESIKRMKQLFREGEYEKAVEACEEIERLDPKNFSARIFKKKARRVIQAEIETEMVAKLKKAWLELTPLFQKNPAQFVKI